MRLRQALDFLVGHCRSEHASQIFNDHPAANRQQAIDDPAGEWNLSPLRYR